MIDAAGYEGWSMEFYQDRRGKWRWRLSAPNHEVVAASTQGFVDADEASANAVRTQRALAMWGAV